MRDGARGQHQPQFLSALDDARIYRELSVGLAAQGQRSARQVAQNPAIDDGLLQRTGFVAGLVLCAHHETLETWGQPALDRDLRSVIERFVIFIERFVVRGCAKVEDIWVSKSPPLRDSEGRPHVMKELVRQGAVEKI